MQYNTLPIPAITTPYMHISCVVLRRAAFLCTAVCTGGCFNSGTCVDPESCDCPPNWTGQYCNEGTYISVYINMEQSDYIIFMLYVKGLS